MTQTVGVDSVGETAQAGGYPAEAEVAAVREDARFQRAVTAYRFWYPTVSVEGIFQGNRDIGIEDGATVGIAATGPRQVGFTLNSDTPYGAAAIDLRGGPVVIELPPGPYIGLVDDRHQRWVLDMGIPGPDGGKGGRHLVLPPGHTGDVPEGYYAARSNTNINLLALRALPVGGDMGKALEALRAVKVYPLDRPGDLMGYTDITERASDNSCLKWEDDLEFWRVLNRVVNEEPVTDEFRPMYGLLTALGIGKGQKFDPDEATARLLERAARAGLDQMRAAAFASDRPDRIAWPDRRWEWVGLVADDPNFETPEGLDLDARDRWFYQAIVASPAMFRRVEGAGSLYWLGHRDADGEYLDGGTDYRLTLPAPVPGKLFWSVTAYDARTRSQVQTDQDQGALRSLVELAGADPAAPVDLYFGPNPPAGAEDRWLKTVPGRGWFAYIRIYGPEAAAFDGTWKPGDLRRVPADR
ncbi:DUF1254 domain-containing protein [Glycomyces sp. NPDC047010]|uniref:DUF1254 domain-containing protein n=1 Tax=Glycomyces sp. NPDC047010 TaxID=3155023 RepID=UPI0033D4E2B9